ncbi:Decaprenyl diphosphate synthase-like protein [Xylariaceae sp. FL0804]|nr:Decaprenyl diphosphate synthase-like protein [Xylariaceae sp. FL0804]
MSFNARDTEIYRRDEKARHRTLGPEQREELVKNYLPAPPRPPQRSRAQQNRSRSHEKVKQHDSSLSSSSSSSSRFGVRRFLRAQLHVLLYVVVHALFSLYIRLRAAYRAVGGSALSVLKYHHGTPEYVRRDVAALRRLPAHLSVILTLEDGGRGGDALEKLVNEVSEVAAWCAAAGIARLSVYEKTGILKRYTVQTHRAVCSKLNTWFGKQQTPRLRLSTRGTEPIDSPNRQSSPGQSLPPPPPPPSSLEIILICQEDGREVMVDLTRVLATMVQLDKIAAAEIGMDVIDSELSEAVMPEPDLLLSFEPYVDLQGYPPWPLRLTEIYCAPDNQGLGYQVFLRGLRKYSDATFKLGK